LGYISPICPDPPIGISTKFCTAVQVVAIIICDKYFGDRLRDFDSMMGQKWSFPLTKPLAVNTADATAQRVMSCTPVLHHISLIAFIPMFLFALCNHFLLSNLYVPRVNLHFGSRSFHNCSSSGLQFSLFHHSFVSYLKYFPKASQNPICSSLPCNSPYSD